MSVDGQLDESSDLDLLQVTGMNHGHEDGVLDSQFVTPDQKCGGTLKSSVGGDSPGVCPFSPGVFRESSFLETGGSSGRVVGGLGGLLGAEHPVCSGLKDDAPFLRPLGQVGLAEELSGGYR